MTKINAGYLVASLHLYVTTNTTSASFSFILSRDFHYHRHSFVYVLSTVLYKIRSLPHEYSCMLVDCLDAGNRIFVPSPHSNVTKLFADKPCYTCVQLAVYPSKYKKI